MDLDTDPLLHDFEACVAASPLTERQFAAKYRLNQAIGWKLRGRGDFKTKTLKKLRAAVDTENIRNLGFSPPREIEDAKQALLAQAREMEEGCPGGLILAAIEYQKALRRAGEDAGE